MRIQLSAAALFVGLVAGCTAPSPENADPEAGDEAPAGTEAGDESPEGGGDEVPPDPDPDPPAAPEGELDGPCFPNSTCAGGLLCNADNVCEAPPPADKKDFGEPCGGADECDSGVCVAPAVGGQKACSRECGDGCPGGWACRGFAIGGVDDTFLCLPPPAACTGCLNAGECGGSPEYECLNARGASICGFACDSGDVCPDSFVCDVVENVDGKRCVPVDICAIVDTDEDGVADADDNCVAVANSDQANADEDAHGDACDNCTDAVNDDQADCDGDTLGDACDEPCPFLLKWVRIDEAGPPVANDDHAVKSSIGTRVGGPTVANEDFQISLKVQGIP